MHTESSSVVRSNWSETCDSVIREKPKFIKRTRDCLWLSSIETMSNILQGYKFTADKYTEEDGSVTLSLNEMDIVENGQNEHDAVKKLSESILEYANEYYDEYELYSRSSNRKGHLPYVVKALIMDDVDMIGEEIVCHDGKN